MSESRVAPEVSDLELASFQRAVRTMLRFTVVTPTTVGTEDFERVRRWSPQLTRAFSQIAGYTLHVAPVLVRLVRRFDRLDPTHPLTTSTGRRFDRRRYAYLCLALAALGRSPGQITLSDLSQVVRSLAAEVPSLGFDPDAHPERMAFVDAVAKLEELAAITATDGSTNAWQKDPTTGDALYDVDRDVCHALFSPPRILQHVRSAAELLDERLPVGRDVRRLETRQRLGRLILEFPVVYYADLDDLERRYLQTEAREIAAHLERLTGARLERRIEGVALIDTVGLSDRRFPGTGTPSHIALLLGEHLVRATRTRTDALPTARPPGADEARSAIVSRLDAGRPQGEQAPHGPAASGPALGDDERVPVIEDHRVLELLRDIHARYRKAIAQEYREDVDALAGAAMQVLEDFDLVRRVDGGWVVLPALARYRRVTVTVQTLFGAVETEAE